MDQFVTTYRKDYLWPYIKSFGKKLLEPPLTSTGYEQKCHCHCYPPVPPHTSHKNLAPDFDTQNQDWSRVGPMGPLLEPKLYPPQVGKSPETNTMQLDQPNTFLKKLHEKYPFLYEILQTSPTADLYSKINKDRIRTTYQVDYCKLDETPPEELLRVGGVGLGPCSDPVRMPGDPYKPNQTDISFKTAMENQVKRTKCISGAPGGGKGSGGGGFSGGGGGGIAPWVPGITEYQDGISKIGGLIIKDKIHSHNKKR